MNKSALGTVKGTVNMNGYYNTVWTRMECNLLIYKDLIQFCGLKNTLRICLWRSRYPPYTRNSHLLRVFYCLKFIIEFNQRDENPRGSTKCPEHFAPPLAPEGSGAGKRLSESRQVGS
jgi:hypothetical protein